MSVIAKFAVRSVEDFGTGKLLHLSCWCDQDLMAAYAEDESDKLFTKYSPSGDMKLCQPQHCQLGQPGDYEFSRPDEAFYVMMLNADELPEGADKELSLGKHFPGASLAFKGSCFSLTDFGHGKQVIFTGAPGQSHLGMDRFRWQMMVDNPGASAQFRPGHDVWIAFYPCARFSRNQAIAAAHDWQA